MSESELILKSLTKSSNAIVVFTGYPLFSVVLNQAFDFKNLLSGGCKEVDRYFYKDTRISSYHKGINGLTNNIDETVEYLKRKLENYENIVFVGVSSGGYAAILFGSLLNINKVIAFKPQTRLFNEEKDYNKKYIDLINVINDVTLYELYGDKSIDMRDKGHHIFHCRHLEVKPNVIVKEYDRLNMRVMRSTGELLNIIKSSLNAKN